MHTLTTISDHDRTILPLAPLLCLAKAGAEPKYLSAVEQTILLEAAVAFGVGGKMLASSKQQAGKSDRKGHLFSEIGVYFLTHYFLPTLAQHHISLVYSLKHQLPEVSQKEPDYIEKMLCYGAKLCDLDMSTEDRVAKAIILGNICNALEIPEQAMAEHPILNNLLEIGQQDNSGLKQAKDALLMQLEDWEEAFDDYGNSLPTMDEIIATISTDGIHGEFGEDIIVITENEAAKAVDEQIAEKIGDITPDKLILAIGRSFSLNIEEKHRVLEAISTLSVFQIVLLMQTFLEEADHFVTLAIENPVDIQKLSIKQRLEWLVVKRDLSCIPEKLNISTKVHIRKMMKEAVA